MNTVLRRKKIIDFQQGYLLILIIRIIQSHIIRVFNFIEDKILAFLICDIYKNLAPLRFPILLPIKIF